MKAALKPLMSSASVEWETPQDFFDELDAEFKFDLDVCADLFTLNNKCANFCYVKGLYIDSVGWRNYANGGLDAPWHEVAKTCWMNPPYGRTIGKWVQKAYDEAQLGCTVVCLLPARTDTKWFHEYCTKGEIRFIKGRLKFGGHKNAAPFPSMVVIFKPND